MFVDDLRKRSFHEIAIAFRLLSGENEFIKTAETPTMWGCV